MYVCVTESLCYAAVINTTLKINYTSIKKLNNFTRGSPISKCSNGTIKTWSSFTGISSLWTGTATHDNKDDTGLKSPG